MPYFVLLLITKQTVMKVMEIIQGDFNYGYGDNQYKLVSCEIEFPYKPSENEVRKTFLRLKNQYREGSIYNTCNFTHCVIYYSVWGWSGKWVAYLDSTKEYFNKPFPSEPTGKYGKERKEFKI